MTRRLHDIREIVAMLAARIEPLARELFPAGKRDGLEWRVGSLAGEPGQSLGIHLRAPKAGVWKDFSGGEGGDALDLVAAARFGGSKAEALRWARAWLGLEAGGDFKTVRPAPPPPRDRKAEEAEAEGGRQKARALWLGGRLLADTPAAIYLTGRGVGPDRLGRVPGALRFRPDVWCSERQVNAPAMVSAIVKGGKIIGCHRTFLAERPGGQWGKAPIRSAKKVLGQIGGGFIPLWRRSGRPMGEAPNDDTLAIAEGIEDGLTIALHQPEWRVIAAVSGGNMARLELHERFADIVLVFDRDGENPSAARAREAAVDELLHQGRSVREVRPPEGFKDFNAWHMAEVAAEAAPRRKGGAA
jgi:hypothetical protein